MSELDNLDGGAVERPQFLKVMCIIAWVLHGLGAIFSGIAWAGAGVASSMADTGSQLSNELSSELADNPEFQQAMEEFGEAGMDTIGAISTTSMVGFLGAVICILGAVMMWKLKKTGFFIYVVGILVPIITTTMMLAFPFVGALFGIAMIVLFGLNLKHLR